MKLLSVNKKMKKTADAMGVRLFNFGIRTTTCIGALECKSFCYADRGAYVWGNVRQAYDRRTKASKSESFCENIWEEIVSSRADYVRIHDSGDFYSREYLHKWIKVIESLPHVHFYAYTKSIPLFLNETMPDNFTVCFSYGGKYDHLINPAIHRHSIVVDEIPEEYADASHNDLVMIGDNHRIGLLKH